MMDAATAKDIADSLDFIKIILCFINAGIWFGAFNR